MNKRMLLRMTAFLLALSLLPVGVAFAAGQKAEKKVTVMLYLCGADLESKGGEGSETISDILKSEFNRDAVNVVALLGGSARWQTGYSPKALTLLTFEGSRRPTKVAEWSPASMGDPATLTNFLAYCKENYPAERYDMILWDHGGGPNLGICQDETFRKDSLSMHEVAQALKDSPFANKGLDIILFDACLMGSAEVAVMVAPYAKYMVATEDSMYGSGNPINWLKGMESETSFETAKRWVDGCYEFNNEVVKRQKSTQVVSSAVVDLSKIDGLLTAVDEFYTEARGGLNEGSFTAIANQRGKATAFGVTESGGQSMYDLVDLGDLIQKNSSLSPDSANRVMDAIRACVPYCRSVTPDAYGLTVYHPYINKNYAPEWVPVHSQLGFSKNYEDYILAFSAILTGVPLATWNKLVAEKASAVKDNRVLFTLKLTDDQAAHYGDARMNVLLLNDDGTYTFTFRTNDVLYEDGTVTADFNGIALYAVDAEGNAVSAPLPYTPVNADTIQIPAVVYKNATEDMDGFEIAAIVTCGYDPATKQLSPGAVALWDEGLGAYTAAFQMAFDDYDGVAVTLDTRRETRTEAGALKAFADWEVVSQSEWRADIDGSWSFRMLNDTIDPEKLYASFEVTDSQNNRYSSEPSQVRTQIGAAGEVRVAYDDANLVLINHLTLTPSGDQLLLSMDLKSLAQQEAIIVMEDLTVNGIETGITEEVYGNGENDGLIQNEEQILMTAIPKSVLEGQEAVTGVSFVLKLLDAETDDELGAVPVEVTLNLAL